MNECRIGLLGAGWMARCHVHALRALEFFYEGHARPVLRAVASPTPASRQALAQRFGIPLAVSPDDLWARDDLDAIMVTGTNETHFAHLIAAADMPSVAGIYVEKPLCASAAQEHHLAGLPPGWPPRKRVQVGFQFLQTAPIRRALALVRTGTLRRPVHFQARYLHGGYLEKSYREKRQARLQPAPAGGAIADLGSHVYSFLVAFLGERLEVIAARTSGGFDDVSPGSDLCAVVLLRDVASGAVGSATASRISAGAGDLLELDIRYTNGAIKWSTERPDVLEVCEGGRWFVIPCGNDYSPASTSPAPNFSAGWLRSLMHAQYLFLGGEDPVSFVPDLRHGLAVQRLIRRTAEELVRDLQ